MTIKHHTITLGRAIEKTEGGGRHITGWFGECRIILRPEKLTEAGEQLWRIELQEPEERVLLRRRKERQRRARKQREELGLDVETVGGMG